MSEHLSAREAFDNATYKQAADKIRQILSAIRNNPASSAKRWVWELMQNAKDLPNNRFGKVSIEIELVSENELKFKHNGDPFAINNITGLIRQVSSKSSLNEDYETTGKFGTGFICTHLLSDIIDVEGVLNYNGFRAFELELDRSGRSSEELVPRIRAVEKKFLEPDSYFSIIPNYEENRTEDDYDTVFTYHLSSNEKLNSAKAGLDDLINTLPITLVTQAKKIKQVRVIDRVRNTEVTYVCDSKELDNNVIYSKISINSHIKQYLTYRTQDVALTTEVKITDNGYELLKRDNTQPVLYRDFPLVGSEDFYFPYTLNGFRFWPTEKRNSIPLNGEDNLEAKDNREIISLAVEASLKFNEWLIAHNATNRYLIAYSPRPKPEVEYDEAIALPWINELQKNWRIKLLDQALLETEDGVYPVRELSAPAFHSYSASEEFFTLLDGFYIGRGHLPVKGHLKGWLKILNAEYKSWGVNLKYEKDDFLKDLSNLQNINSLSSKIGKSHDETIGWLNKVYKFLEEQNMLNELDNYAIIPNQRGEFKYLKELYSDHTSRIPTILKDIYNSVNPDNATVQHMLMNPNVDATVFGNSIRSFSLKEMIDKLSEYIKSSKNIIKDGVNINLPSTIAYKIISLFPKTEDKGTLNKRKKMYDFSSAYRTMDEYTEIEIADPSLWKDADLYWFSYSYTGIESTKDVSNFAKNFFLQEKTMEDALIWLNEYLQFYRENSYGDFIKNKSVFPRQLSINSENGKYTFLKLDDLRYDNEVPEEFKSLGNYAVDITNRYDYCRQFLLHRSIKGYENHRPFSIKDVYEYVKKRFDESNGETREVIARHTISILTKQENADPEEKKLYEFSKTISDHSFNEAQYVESHTGFYWGFAQDFYLKYICKRIAESINIDGFKQLNLVFSNMNNAELTLWIDSLIEFLHSYKDKKYWPIITDKENGFGIWLNQNNDFCKFQDVRKDTGIPEDLKDLAVNNRHIKNDYREILLSSLSSSYPYLETTPFTISEIGKDIDKIIKDYDGNKQEVDFRSLVFTLNKLTALYPPLRDSMENFEKDKNSLIVWSMGEGATMDLVSSLIQQGDDKLKAVKDFLIDTSVEDLKNLNSVLKECPPDKLGHLKDFINNLTNEEVRIDDGETPIGGEDEMEMVVVPKIHEIEVEDFRGNKQIVKLDQVQYAGLSLDEIEKYVGEAKDAVVKYFKERNEKHNSGYQFDDEKIAKHSYSQLYGISDRNGNEIPIVVHSYKGPQYRYFDLNWYDWQLLSKKGAMLFVLTVTGLQCIPLYALPVRNFNISISNDMSNETRAALLTLAAVGKEYSPISFDFGNNMPQGFKDPVPFDYVPEQLGACISSIKEVCDKNIPQIANMYNSGKNVALVRSAVGYSIALSDIDAGKARDIFEAPANDTVPPSVGTAFID